MDEKRQLLVDTAFHFFMKKVLKVLGSTKY